MNAYYWRVRGFRRDIKLFLLYNLVANVGFGVFQLIYNLYLTQLNLREDFIGAFNAVQTVAMAVGAVSMGRLLNRFGTWRCIVGGVGVFQGASLGLAFAEQRPLLLALSACSGFGLAFLFTATMPFIVEWARRDERPDVAALSFSLISLAATIGALVGGFLPSLVSGPLSLVEAASLEAYRVTLVTGSLVGVCGLLPLFMMGPARQRKPPVDHAAAKAAEDELTRRQTRRDVSVFVAIGGLMALGAGMVIPFFNVYLKSLGASTSEVGYVYALGGLSAALIGLAAPAVSRRIGALRAVAVLRLAIVPFYLLLILMPTTWIAVLAYLVRQTSISMAWPIDSTFIAEVLPARARAGVFGLRSAAWNVGFAAASLVGGRIIVDSGYNLTFASLILFSIVAAVFFATYFGRHPRIRDGQIPSALPRGQRAVAAAVAEAEPAPETGAAA